MRTLAEYIMRGRAQAILVAVLGVGSLFFAWLGAAAVALVTLRKGPGQGMLVLIWALLPASVIMIMGRDIGPLAALVGVSLAAVVLRRTVSLAWAMIACAVSGGLTALMLLTIGESQLDSVMAVLQQFVDNLQTQVQSQAANQNGEAGQAAQVSVSMPSKADVAGLIGVSNAFSVAVSLLLARWWQGMLYNPGGFRAEFHSLRLTPVVAALCIAAAVLLGTAGDTYRVWVFLPLVPLLFAGFGLIHGVIGLKNWPRGALIGAYVAWIILDPARLALLIATLADSFMDFRRRIGTQN